MLAIALEVGDVVIALFFHGTAAELALSGALLLFVVFH